MALDQSALTELLDALRSGRRTSITAALLEQLSAR